MKAWWSSNNGTSLNVGMRLNSLLIWVYKMIFWSHTKSYIRNIPFIRRHLHDITLKTLKHIQRLIQLDSSNLYHLWLSRQKLFTYFEYDSKNHIFVWHNNMLIKFTVTGFISILYYIVAYFKNWTFSKKRISIVVE